MADKTLGNYYNLRIRLGSEIDTALRAYQNSDEKLSGDHIRKVAGTKRAANILYYLAKSVDNLSVIGDPENMTVRYIDTNPVVPTAVGVDVKKAVIIETSAGSAAAPKHEHVDAETWCQMPPVPMGIGSAYREPSWFKTMQIMVKAGKHVSLAGAPGTGKDTAIEELAAREGKPLVTVAGDGGLRKRDLVGQTEIVDGSTTFKVAEFAQAVISGYWASITEVNTAEPDVLILLNAVMTAPYIIMVNGKAYPVHKDFRLFVSYNPGLAGTKPLNPAFKDRFFSITVPWFTKGQLVSVLQSHGLPEDAPYTADLVKFAFNMLDAYDRGAMRYQITSRRLMDAVLLMNLQVVDTLKEALKQAVLASIDSPVELKAAYTVLNTTLP